MGSPVNQVGHEHLKAPVHAWEKLRIRAHRKTTRKSYDVIGCFMLDSSKDFVQLLQLDD